MAKPKAWREGAPGEPAFGAFEIEQRAVLQWTDIVSNHNKYYAIELHRGAPGSANAYRVYTHYGRTDDLETNPNAGARESRYFGDAGSAAATYQQIYKEKTNKGYKEISLASSKIGSHQARGQASGAVDKKTLERIEGDKKDAGKDKPPPPPKSALPDGVQSLVRMLYDEATNALTTTVAAKITANGIETPLGVLTIGQIEKGEAILKELYDLFQGAKKSPQKMVELSGDFYSAIPHRIGRTRDAVQAATISSLADFEAKQETLQLMKDMLKVNGEAGSVLFDDAIDAKYGALSCLIMPVASGSDAYQHVKNYVEGSQVKTKSIRVKNIYTLFRKPEHEAFESKIGNERLLFHGSRIKNWVGILSRGILLPKIVVSMGVHRTDAGWLGNGLYFGDAACTSSFYTTPARDKRTRFMAVATVALGKQKEFTKITYGMNEAPAGFDSTWGVRNKPGAASQFADDEYVVYRTSQQRLDYFVEFTS
jgi:predicted DNA-binding WGR domain protein